jgi:hypothetical protein
MRDQWTKKRPDGQIVVYVSEFDADHGGGIVEAHVGEFVHARTVPGPMTREEVEARFTNLPMRQRDAEP